MEVFVDKLEFPEGLRWHEGRLWFSDMNAGSVSAADAGGRVEHIVDVPGNPSGLGWLPDGRLLVVSMQSKSLMRLDADGLKLHADLSAMVSHPCNDMIVERSSGSASARHIIVSNALISTASPQERALS